MSEGRQTKQRKAWICQGAFSLETESYQCVSKKANHIFFCNHTCFQFHCDYFASVCAANLEIIELFLMSDILIQNYCVFLYWLGSLEMFPISIL